MILNAFIVDDEPKTRNILQALLLEFCPGVAVKGMVGDITEAVAAIPKQHIDILFLDINLGNNNTGFDLLDQLKPYDFDIVFVTAYETHALKAFDYGAAHYLLKPVNHNVLQETMDRIRKRKEMNNATGMQQLANTLQQALLPVVPRIALSDMNKTEFVSIDDIAFLESNGSYTIFHLKDKRHFIRSKNLKYFEDALMAYPKFIRVHKSYVINRDQVRSFRKSTQELELFSGAIVPVSIRYRSLLEQLGHHLIL
ncbi:MAG: LytTR family DNA-binding domain-containing protein [Taibaiella sp.]|jgi:two-component system LytT family response regulator